jgi:hypothetical protein
MESIHNGQCGLCLHFGEHHKTHLLVGIRCSHRADAKMLDECGHPRYAGLRLKVSPLSGCDGFYPAASASAGSYQAKAA